MKVGYCEKCGQRVMVRDPEAEDSRQVYCDECRRQLFGDQEPPGPAASGSSSSRGAAAFVRDGARRPKSGKRRPGRESRTAPAGGGSKALLAVGAILVAAALALVAVVVLRASGGGAPRDGAPTPGPRPETAEPAVPPAAVTRPKPSAPAPGVSAPAPGVSAPAPSVPAPVTEVPAVPPPSAPAPAVSPAPAVEKPPEVPKTVVEKPEPPPEKSSAPPKPAPATEPAALKSFGGAGGTVTIAASATDKEIKDSMLRVQQADNNGARNFPDLIAGNDSPWTSYALIKADLSSLPADAKITEARLLLHCYNTYGNRSVTLYPVLKEWDWAQACFNKRKGKEAWNEGGKPFKIGAGTSDYDISAGVKIPAVGKGVVPWDITDIVKKWANGSLPNNGVVLIADHPKSEMKFRSTNHKVAAEWPKLVVKYTGGWAGGKGGELPKSVRAMPIPAETARLIAEAQRLHDVYEALGSAAVLCSRYRFGEAASRLGKKAPEDELLKGVLADLRKTAGVMNAIEESVAALKGKSLNVQLSRGRIEGTVEGYTSGTVRLRTSLGTPSMLSLRQAPLELLRKWAKGADERDALLLIAYMGAELPEGVDDEALSEGARLIRSHKQWAAKESAAERAFRKLSALEKKKDWGGLITSAVDVAQEHMGTYEVGVERRLELARLLREALGENAGKAVEGTSGPLVPDELEWLLYQGGEGSERAPEAEGKVGDIDI